MVLLVLFVLWGIVLIPPAWRAHSERKRQRSVDRFRRTLQVLAPPEPARATRAAEAARPAGAARSHVALIAEPTPPPVAAGQSKAGQTKPSPPRSVPAAWRYTPGRVVPAAPPPAPRPEQPRPRMARRELIARRRLVLGTLVVATVGTAAGVTFSTLTALRGVQLLADAALIGYVIGLRRLHRLALERRAKVRYLPATAIPVELPAESEADTLPLRTASASS